MDDSSGRKKPPYFELPQRPRRAVRREGRIVNPFADRSSLLVRTLCESPDHTWELRALAKAAGISAMVASGALKQLEALGDVVTVDRSGARLAIQLASLERMLRAWSASYAWDRNPSRAFRAPPGDPLEYVRRAAPAWERHRWALTLQVGASLVAPGTAGNRAHVYIDVESEGILQAIGEEAGWLPDPTGQMVLMKPYYRESMWEGVRVLEGLPVVSTVQLIVDLASYADGGPEQARRLLRSLGDE